MIDTDKIVDYQKHRRKRKRKRNYVVEYRYIGNASAFAINREWSIWHKYKTIKSAIEAVMQLNRSAYTIKGQPLYEYRLKESEIK